MKFFSLETLIVTIMIVIIALSSIFIYGSGLNVGFSFFVKPPPSTSVDLNVDTMNKHQTTSALISAEEYYKLKDFVSASTTYLNLIIADSLTDMQKIYVYTKLGLCYFNTGEYDKSATYSLSILEIDPNYSLAYNNAAVAYHYAGNIELAKLYIDTAIGISPTVEYFYNKARFAEINLNYDEAIKNLNIASNGEQNFTLIDPISVRTRLGNLLGNKKISDYTNAVDVKIALKLKDASNVLIVPDTEMELLGADFILKQAGNKGRKLEASYDKLINDPYHLINSLKWTIVKDSELIYSSSKDKLEYLTSEKGKYDITLSISYKGSKVWVKTKSITITGEAPPPITTPPVTTPTAPPKEEIVSKEQYTKYYTYAIYEQLFEKDFSIPNKGAYDRFNVNWRKSSGLTYTLDSESNLDYGNALHITNDTNKTQNMYINLSPLIADKSLEGKKITLAIYAKKISDSESLAATLRADSNSMTNKSFFLENKYKQITLPIMVSANCSNLTLTMGIAPGDEVVLEGLMIVITK